MVVRRDLVSFVEKWVKKGSGLYVEGKIRTRSYDDQSGVKRYVTEIHADRVEFYSTGSGTGNRDNASGTGMTAAQPQTSQPSTGYQQATGYQQPASGQPDTSLDSNSADDLPF